MEGGKDGRTNGRTEYATDLMKGQLPVTATKGKHLERKKKASFNNLGNEAFEWDGIERMGWGQNRQRRR